MTLPNLENKSILIVEDDDMSFLYLKQLFLPTKSKLTWAKSGREALDFFMNLPAFDLILLDIQLPDADGKEISDEIRKQGSLVPIIAQTAGKTPFEIEKALIAGCSEVITKPFTMEQLYEAIGRYF
jgi:CheY-like chemotaxis protein